MRRIVQTQVMYTFITLYTRRSFLMILINYHTLLLLSLKFKGKMILQSSLTCHIFIFQFSRYCAVLLNDESHSFPEVISVLKRCLKCPQKLATDLTEFIDKEGRAVVKVGSYNVSHFLTYIFFFLLCDVI